MSDDLNPYQEWLGIPPEEQPPDHYRLLGVGLFESDSDVLQRALEERTDLVRRYQLKHPEPVSKLLGEVTRAWLCLSDAEERTEYDQTLGKEPATPEMTSAARADASSEGSSKAVSPGRLKEPQRGPAEVMAPADPAVLSPMIPEDLFDAEPETVPTPQPVREAPEQQEVFWKSPLAASIAGSVLILAIVIPGLFALTGGEKPPPPRLKRLAPQKVELGRTLDLDVGVQDPDAWAGQLRYQLGLEAPSDAKIDERTGRLTWTPQSLGNYSIVVEVTSTEPERQLDTAVFTVNVYRVKLPEAPMPPAIKPPPIPPLVEEAPTLPSVTLPPTAAPFVLPSVEPLARVYKLSSRMQAQIVIAYRFARSDLV